MSECREMGGAVNLNPSDDEVVNCHLDWCVVGAGMNVHHRHGNLQSTLACLDLVHRSESIFVLCFVVPFGLFYSKCIIQDNRSHS